MEVNYNDDALVDDAFLDGLAQVVEDEEPQPKKQEPKKDIDVTGIMNSFQSRAERAETGYNRLQSERDQVTNQYGKLTADLVQRGLATYDPATGAVQLIDKNASQKVDFNSQIKDLSKQINEKKRALLKEFDQGDLTQSEYNARLDEEIEPLIEQRTELKFEKRLAETQKIDDPGTPATPQSVPTDSKTQNALKSAFEDIQNKYPEADDSSSPLFAAMKAVLKDEKYSIADVNYGEMDQNGNITKYTGNPIKRLELIEKAAARLKSGNNKAADDIHKANANRFDGPSGVEWTPGPTTEGMNREQVNIMLSGGFKSKSVIKEVNKVYNQYLNGGAIVLPG